MSVSLGDAVARCEAAGAVVRWAALPTGVRGCYDHETSTIWVRDGMSEHVAVPTILHELHHHLRGDDGPQTAAVEARIDRLVARELITPAAYAAAECVTGGGSGPIAVELGLPRWVVGAYRSTLRR